MTEGTIPATAPLNDLPLERLRLRPDADGRVAIDPAGAGWRYLSFATAALAEGQRLPAVPPGREAVVVIVAGGGVEVAYHGGDGRRIREHLGGRASPFDDVPTAVYLPPGCAADLVGHPAQGFPVVEVAVGSAPVGTGSPGAAAPAPGRPAPPAAAGAPEPRIVRPGDVEVEIRGAGNATRQINHILRPDFPARRLLAVEVLTPSGNWSSWPPHKHDVDAMPGEAVLEEIYHYRFRDPRAWALQRLYRRPDSVAGTQRDGLWAVGDGDVVLVTDGYHPFVAAHGHDAWYLNVLAGDRRTMACSDDPDLAFVRQGWASMAPDPRLPLSPPQGRG